MKGSHPFGLAIRLAWAVPFLVTIAAWAWGSVLNPLPFWQVETDYSWLSLSHAYTVEARLAGHPALNHGYTVHPGVPFGIVSWIALRLSTLSVAGAEGRIVDGLVHADRYWMWAKFMALLLNLAGLGVLRYLFRGRLQFYLMAAAAYLACLPAVYNAALFQLSNESLALLYLTGFYTLAYIALSPVASATGSGLPRRQQATCFFLGVLTAAGWSIKIYYLAPSIGLVAGMLTASALGILPWKSLRSAAGFYFAGLVVGVSVVGFGFLGWDALKAWWLWNWKMLTHTGRYGNAGDGFLSSDSVLAAAKALVVSTRGAFPAMVAVLATLTFRTIGRNWHDQNWKKTWLPFSVAALAGVSINLLAALKHYAPHYCISVAASLAWLLFIVSSDRTGSRAFRVLYVLIPVCLLLTLDAAKEDHLFHLNKSAAVLRDIEAIFKLPMEPGKRRMWAYFSPSREGTAPLVAYEAGSPFVEGIIKKTIGATDNTPNLDPNPGDWQYIIFPRRYYPTAASLVVNYKKMFDFKSGVFEMTGGEKVTELETFLVVEPSAR